MKAILQSIRPQHCANIAARIKKIEVRKTKPSIPTPFKVYIYCTKDKHSVLLKNQYGLKLCYAMNLSTAIAVGGTKVNGKVIGEYVCDRICPIVYTMDGFADIIDCELSCLKPQDFIKYGKGKTLYGWHISNLVIYDKPKELSEFIYLCPEYTKERFTEKCRKCPHYFRNDFDMCFQCDCEGEKPITRPPQSWCYVKKERESI